MSDRYGYSFTTNTWYKVLEYEEAGNGKIIAKEKEEVERSEVPQEWLDAVNERE